jgi:hypothetical protein
VPSGRQRSGFRLAVADHHGHNQIRVVEGGAVGVRYPSSPPSWIEPGVSGVQWLPMPPEKENCLNSWCRCFIAGADADGQADGELYLVARAPRRRRQGRHQHEDVDGQRRTGAAGPIASIRAGASFGSGRGIRTSHVQPVHLSYRSSSRCRYWALSLNPNHR